MLGDGREAAGEIYTTTEKVGKEKRGEEALLTTRSRRVRRRKSRLLRYDKPAHGEGTGDYSPKKSLQCKEFRLPSDGGHTDKGRNNRHRQREEERGEDMVSFSGKGHQVKGLYYPKPQQPKHPTAEGPENQTRRKKKEQPVKAVRTRATDEERIWVCKGSFKLIEKRKLKCRNKGSKKPGEKEPALRGTRFLSGWRSRDVGTKLEAPAPSRELLSTDREGEFPLEKTRVEVQTHGLETGQASASERKNSLFRAAKNLEKGGKGLCAEGKQARQPKGQKKFPTKTKKILTLETTGGGSMTRAAGQVAEDGKRRKKIETSNPEKQKMPLGSRRGEYSTKKKGSWQGGARFWGNSYMSRRRRENKGRNNMRVGKRNVEEGPGPGWEKKKIIRRKRKNS